MTSKLPLPVFYIPPRPAARQHAEKNGPREHSWSPEAIPRAKSPPPPPKRPTTAPRVHTPIQPISVLRKASIDWRAKPIGKHLDSPDDDNNKQRRRHSATDDVGLHDQLQDVSSKDRGIRKVYAEPEPESEPEPQPQPEEAHLILIPKPRMEKMSAKKPSTTPAPPTRTGRKIRGVRPYGYEDPLLDGYGRDYKARLVTFYKNGDAYFTGIKVSFRPGRDFVSMESLYNHLTTRMDLPTGVRYIFTLEGIRIRRLDEFENGASYVCSSRRKFEPINYTAENKKTWNPHLKFENPNNDQKLFRAPSPPIKKINGVRERWSPDAPYNGSLPGSREGRVIKVINNLNHKIQSRILLNLRTAQPWEEVLEDLGQALKLKGAKKLFTLSGLEVKSFSQLRNEFKDVETFYLDTGDSHLSRLVQGESRKESSRSLEDHLPYNHRETRGKRPGSAPPVPGDRASISSNEMNKISPPADTLESSSAAVRVLINGARRDLYPPLHQRLRSELSAPDKYLKLDWVYGYKGYNSKRNLEILSTGELLYYVATVAVMLDKVKHKQRHYTGHTEDITCLALTTNKDVCATGQREGKGKTGLAHVRVWNTNSLETLSIVGLNEIDSGVAALAFSVQNNGHYLMVVDDSSDHVLSTWDWKYERILGRTTTYSREVHGGHFYPDDDNVIVTFGRSYLTTWRRRKDGMFQKNELLKAIGDIIMCIEFDQDGNIIAGDSSGAISVWSDNQEGGFRLTREFQAHQRGINSLLVLNDGTLLSGGNDRFIKAWRNIQQYKLIATASLPDTAGGVRTLCPQKMDSDDSSIYVGTTRNMILEGSLYRRFAIVLQGHYKNISAIAIDPDYSSFITAGYDRSICKWSLHRLLWRVQIDNECTALAFHPSDLVVVVGTQDGHFLALNADSGMHVATNTVNKAPITCLAFNKDGSYLAVGSKDGNIYLYLVTNSGFVYKRRNVMRGNDTLRNIDFSSDGKYLQTDTDDYDLLFWYIPNLEQEKLPSTMRDIKWNRITCTLGYSIHGIWNNMNQRIQGLVTSCHVSSAQRLLAAADDEGYVRLFRFPCISSKADFHEIKPYSGPVNVIRFLYDDSFLITAGGTDASLMQWMVIPNR